MLLSITTFAISDIPVLGIMLIVGVLLYKFSPDIKKVCFACVVVVGLYWMANGHLPWTSKQGKNVTNKVLAIFKDEKK